jgi:hypothetical protein
MGEIAASVEDENIRSLTSRGLKIVDEVEGSCVRVFEQVSCRGTSHTPSGFFLSQHLSFAFINGVFLSSSSNASSVCMSNCSCNEEWY